MPQMLEERRNAVADRVAAIDAELPPELEASAARVLISSDFVLDTLEQFVLFVLTNLFVFATIQNVCLRDVKQPPLGEHHLNDVLNVFYTRDALDKFLIDDLENVIGDRRIELVGNAGAGRSPGLPSRP